MSNSSLHSTTTVAGSFLGQVRELLRSLPPADRFRFSSFWSGIRDRLNSLELQVGILDQQNAQLKYEKQVLQNELQAAKANLQAAEEVLGNVLNQTPASSASRPKTSASENQLRFEMQVLMDMEFASLNEASETIENIWDLDPGWVRGKLSDDRELEAEHEDPRWQQLDCWMRRVDTTHQYGYTKVNLRNTFRPGTSKKINCQPFRHQLAVVASGLGQNLLRTSAPNGTDEVSHLCHNHRCFNPDHILVESKDTNRKRWGCVGAWIIKCAVDGTIYHPCRHGEGEQRRKCILPRIELEAHKYYQNTIDGPKQL